MTRASDTVVAAPAGDVDSKEKSSSYYQILRSSILIGGSSALGLLLGLVRNKATALLLGPAGFGLMGLYVAITDVARSIAEMGINQSGVRQIAESAAHEGTDRAAVTAYVLRRASVVLGILGAVGLFLCAEQVAIWSFGSSDRAYAVRILAAVVFFRLVSDGQSALLQGLRRIGDLAKVNVLGNLYGTIAVVAIIYAVGERGIVLGLAVAGALTMFTAAWYVRKLNVHIPKVPISTVSKEAGELLKLGFAFMVSAFVMMGASYAVRAIVSNMGGLHSAGLYQAAWALGGLYVGFVLQAMGTDFYPRLVGVIGDVAERNRLTNEQMMASLVLAGPGILATLALAPLVLNLLYSSEFQQAAPTLRWICFGMALRVLTWPPGYLIVSMNERWVFMGVEVAWGILNVLLTFALVRSMGLEGAGIAFAASYLFHGVLVYSVVRWRYAFKANKATMLAGATLVLGSSLIVGAFYVFAPAIASVVAVVLTSVLCVIWLRILVAMLPAERIPNRILHCLRLLRLRKVTTS